jgi:hypothetical protein
MRLELPHPQHQVDRRLPYVLEKAILLVRATCSMIQSMSPLDGISPGDGPHPQQTMKSRITNGKMIMFKRTTEPGMPMRAMKEIQPPDLIQLKVPLVSLPLILGLRDKNFINSTSLL